MMFSYAAAMAASLGAMMRAMKIGPRLGPGRRTLYTVWKKVDPEHRDRAPVITWPEPLTRQCRRQLDRMALKHHASKVKKDRCRKVDAELAASRKAGLDLPMWRLIYGDAA